jgi:disulfide bond formation protein DsbB
MGIDADQLADLQGTLVTAGAFIVVGLLLLRVLAPTRFDALRDVVDGDGVALAAAVAVLATGASLWWSEGAHFPPCELCWYQRIAMYPLALLLPIAAWRHDRGFRPYGLVLATAGLVVSAWHNSIETFPHRDPGGCDPDNPCTIRWVEGLGVWTIPRMAFVCFALVLTLLLLDRPRRTEAA